MTGRPKIKRLLWATAVVVLAGTATLALVVGPVGNRPPDDIADGDPPARSAKEGAPSGAITEESTEPRDPRPSVEARKGGSEGGDRGPEAQIAVTAQHALEATASGKRQDCDLYLEGTCTNGQSSVDPTALGRTTAEVRVARVKVVGKKATAELTSGGEFRLRRQAGRWKIAGFNAPAGGRAPASPR